MAKRSAKPSAKPGKRSSARPPKTAAANPKWWEEAEEVPRAGLPDADRLNRRAKWLRRYVKSAVFLFPLALFANFITVASAGGEAPAAVVADQYASTKATAMVEVRKWLAQTPSPVPGGVLIGWTSAETRKSPAENGSPETAYAVEVHHLTVADSTGNLYDATVALGVSPYVGAAVIGEPSLEPLAPADTTFQETAWPGLESGYVSDEAEAAILAWASAYSSGDPGQLRLAIGDTSQARSYVPLSGATLTDASIGDAAAVYPDDAPAADRDPNTADTIIVRVQFAIQWKGATLGEDDEWPLVTYDVLVQKANTAAPVVVAWGGPGTGPDLKAYGNAIEHREITAADDSTPTDKNSVVGQDEGDISGDPGTSGNKNDSKKGKNR